MKIQLFCGRLLHNSQTNQGHGCFEKSLSTTLICLDMQLLWVHNIPLTAEHGMIMSVWFAQGM